MSFDARWGGIRIVISSSSDKKKEPAIESPNNITKLATDTPEASSEIIGGIKNAIIRGESIEKAKQSFINAGYKKEEVEKAIQIMSTVKVPEQINLPSLTNQKSSQAPPISKIKTPKQQQKISTTLKIILGISIFLIIVAAALLGIFWDKLI